MRDSTFMSVSVPLLLRAPSNRCQSAPCTARIDKIADRVFEEGLDQQLFRFRLRDSARAQVEHRVVVQRADRGAVPAEHVVGENLELRLGVAFGARAQSSDLKS